MNADKINELIEAQISVFALRLASALADKASEAYNNAGKVSSTVEQAEEMISTGDLLFNFSKIVRSAANAKS